jgi:hypothetical protein
MGSAYCKSLLSQQNLSLSWHLVPIWFSERVNTKLEKMAALEESNVTYEQLADLEKEFEDAELEISKCSTS